MVHPFIEKYREYILYALIAAAIIVVVYSLTLGHKEPTVYYNWWTNMGYEL